MALEEDSGQVLGWILDLEGAQGRQEGSGFECVCFSSGNLVLFISSLSLCLSVKGIGLGLWSLATRYGGDGGRGSWSECCQEDGREVMGCQVRFEF